MSKGLFGGGQSNGNKFPMPEISAVPA